ncbi:MAG TPA: SpoIIE family protein phosphatase, partial [Actinotalea sp.]
LEVADLDAGVRFTSLLSVGGRIYWETHLSPLLLVEGHVDEVALELRSRAGKLPVLLTAVVARSTDDEPTVHVALSSAQERSRYERELLSARRLAETSAARTQVLLDVTSALSAAVGVEGLVAALLAAASGPLRSRAATVWSADREKGLVPVASVGEQVTDAPRPSSVRARLGVASVSSAGRVIVPLLGQSTLQGVLCLAPPAEPGAPAADLATLTAVGQQAGLALERARLYEDRVSVAHRLQQAMLISEPLHDERFAVTTVYRPAIDTLEVGGDWYDAFTAEEDVLVFAVGDVVGRGLPAAITMGQLRSATRALAGPGTGPRALVTGLDRFVAQVPAAASATMVLGRLDLRSGELHYTCAGHPPPVLVPAGRPPRLLWDGRSAPLGAGTSDGRAVAHLVLEPGDHLLLYTDGLIERRGRSLTVGLDQLLEAAGTIPLTSREAAVSELTTRLLTGESARDDVCVLLLSWFGPR